MRFKNGSTEYFKPTKVPTASTLPLPSRTLSEVMPLFSKEVANNKVVKSIILESHILALVLMVATCHGDNFIGIDVGHCQIHNNNRMIELIINREL